MTAGSPEFPRPVTAASVPPSGMDLRLEASEAERAALAERFAVPSVGRLEAQIRLVPRAGGAIDAQGRIVAEVTQVCVVSLEPVSTSLDIPLKRLFRPLRASRTHDDAGELDLTFDPDEEDEEPFDGASFDLGEAVAEELALSLDPFPRHLDARLEALPDEDAEPAPERPNPFASLQGLRRPGRH